MQRHLRFTQTPAETEMSRDRGRDRDRDEEIKMKREIKESGNMRRKEKIRRIKVNFEHLCRNHLILRKESHSLQH